MLPFGGTFDLVQLKGSTLKKAFEHSVYRYGQSTGEFLQVGGKSPCKVGWAFLLVGLAPPLPEPLGQACLGFHTPNTNAQPFQWPDHWSRLASEPQGPENEHHLPSLIWTSDGLGRSWPPKL